MGSDQATKDKILESAYELFAQSGFSATSVREISQLAGVNVSAVNYHFSSKENLYRQVMGHCFLKVEEEISELSHKTKNSIYDFVLGVYRHFIEKQDDLKTFFKIFCSNTEIPLYDGSQPERLKSKIGPPGGEILIELLKLESPKSDHESLVWGARSIYAHIMHKAMVQSSVCQNNSQLVYNSQEDFEKGVHKLVSAVIRELKSSKTF